MKGGGKGQGAGEQDAHRILAVIAIVHQSVKKKVILYTHQMKRQA